MRVCIADAQATSKVKDLQNKVKEHEKEILLLKAKLANAVQEKDLAVKTREVELHKEKYEAVESAMKTGYQRALDNLKELKGFAAGF